MFAGIPITVQHTKYSDIKHDAAPKAMSKLDRDFGSKKKSSSRFELKRFTAVFSIKRVSIGYHFFLIFFSSFIINGYQKL